MGNRGRKPAGNIPSVSVKLRFEGAKPLGPGKVRLLELIDALGSIWAAGREMEMSYGRAWGLANELNGMFNEPLILAQHGGSKRGGATLTELGRHVVARYRSIENGILEHSGEHLAVLEENARKREPDAAGATTP